VDGAIDWIEELPEDGGGAVAEDGALATSEDGGHEAPVEAQAPVADGVDALVDAVESAALRSLGHCVATKTHSFELTQGNHPMLARCEFVEATIERVAFVAHASTKATGPWPLPLRRGFRRSLRPWR
jgi:hypothetical protein